VSVWTPQPIKPLLHKQLALEAEVGIEPTIQPSDIVPLSLLQNLIKFPRRVGHGVNQHRRPVGQRQRIRDGEPIDEVSKDRKRREVIGSEHCPAVRIVKEKLDLIAGKHARLPEALGQAGIKAL